MLFNILVKVLKGKMEAAWKREVALLNNTSRLFETFVYSTNRTSGHPAFPKLHSSGAGITGSIYRYKNSVPLPIPATSLFCSRSIPKTWVYAQRGNDRRPTLIRMHKHPLWVNPRTGAYAIENWIPF